MWAIRTFFLGDDIPMNVYQVPEEFARYRPQSYRSIFTGVEIFNVVS